MQTMKRLVGIKRINLLVLVSAGLIALSSTSWAASYTFTPIALPGATQTLPYGINDAGQMVVDTGIESGILDTNGSFTPIAVPGALSTAALGINNVGQIVGRALNSTNTAYNGFLYSGGVYTTLNFPGGLSTFATEINDAGQIIGYYLQGPNGPDVGFLYSGGVYTTLLPPGATGSFPSAINNAGQIIVGNFLDTNGVYTPLSLPTPAIQNISQYTTLASFTGLNDVGQFVGSFQIILGDYPLGPYGIVANDSFLETNGVSTIFAVPGATRTVGPNAINNTGQIVGGYFNSSVGRDEQGYLATPCSTTDPSCVQLSIPFLPSPEPSTWLLLGSGLVGLILWRKRTA